MDAGRPVADWRSAASYEPLCRCDRHGFAWEWLRRSPAYRAACASADAGFCGAGRFGLHRLEDAERGVPFARPIWCAEADPWVLVATASPGNHGDDLFDAAELSTLADCHAGLDGAEHWLFSDGWHQVRLDIIDGTLRCGAVRLDYRIGGLDRAIPHLATLTRLISLARAGRLVPRLFPFNRRARRLALILRVYDALAAGASQREIAAHLFELGTLPRWRIEAASYRRRVQRLVAATRATAAVDPRLWLDGSIG